jgi:hypothetical protein
MKHSFPFLLLIISFVLLSGTNIFAQTPEQKNAAQKPGTPLGSPNSYNSRDMENAPGFVNITDFSYASGLKETEVAYGSHFFGISTMEAYKWNASLLTGVGVGANFYNGGNHFPLFLDGRYLIGQKVSKAFLDLQAGYLLGKDKTFSHSRYYVNPSAGYSFSVKPKIMLNISVGVWAQWLASVADHRDSFIDLKLGLMFK